MCTPAGAEARMPTLPRSCGFSITFACPVRKTQFGGGFPRPFAQTLSPNTFTGLNYYMKRTGQGLRGHVSKPSAQLLSHQASICPASQRLSLAKGIAAKLD